MLNGPTHTNFRGWLCEEDVHNCVHTISQVDGARLTLDKKTLSEAQIKFNSSIALEVIGTKLNGDEGTLVFAFVESDKIRLITLL